MRTKRTVVILVSGKAGSGKSTVADMLVKKLQDIPSITVMPYGFADPIKYIARAYAEWDEKKDKKGRRLLQQIGAVWREYDENIWVKHFLNQLDKRTSMFPFNFAVVSDWRFPNEFSYLKANPILDIVTVRVYGRQSDLGENASDISENSLPEATDKPDQSGILWNDYDYSVKNDSDLDDLEKKVDIILASISKQYIVE